MIFILHFQFSIAVVSPFSQSYVDAIKRTFANGASDYRRDQRLWLFDEQDEQTVLALVNEHFSDKVVKHFVDMAEVEPA